MTLSYENTFAFRIYRWIMIRDSWTKKMCSIIDKIQRFYDNLNKSVFILDSSYILSNEPLPLSYISFVPTVVLDELWGLQENKRKEKRARSIKVSPDVFFNRIQVFHQVYVILEKQEKPHKTAFFTHRISLCYH